MNSKKTALLSVCFFISFGLCHLASASISVCITTPISSTPILPSTPITSLHCLEQLNLAGTAGEIIAGTFTIQTSTAIPDLTLRSEPLMNQAKTIPASAVDIRYVKVWYQAGTAWVDNRQDKTKKVFVPELLLHDNNFVYVDESVQKNYLVIKNGTKIDISQPANNPLTDIVPIDKYPIQDSDSIEPINLKANTNQQIWLTLHLPSSVQQGQYQGKILIDSTQSNIHLEVPISLNIYPFALAQPDILYSIYYRGILTADNKGSISSENKSTAQMAAEFKNLKDHGVTNPTIYQSPKSSSLFETVLNLRQAAGLDNTNLYYLGIQTEVPGDTSHLQKSIASFQKIYSISKQHNAKKLFIYAIDEANPSLIPAQKPVWLKYKNLGADIFAADYRSGAQNNYAGEVATLVMGSAPDGTANQYLHNKGTRSFLYNQPQAGVENPYIYRLRYGITAWSNDYDGVMDYAYQHSMGDIWNDFDHPEFRDLVFAYPTTNGVIDTLAWEGFREAVVDVEYISTLNKLARLSGSQDDLQYLSKLKYSGTQDLDGMRKNVTDRIITLCTQLKTEASAQICKSPPSPPVVNVNNRAN